MSTSLLPYGQRPCDINIPVNRKNEKIRIRRGIDRKTLLAVASIVLCTVLAYLPAIRGGYIWDDDDYVWQNPTLRSLDGLRQIWFEPSSLPQYYPLVHTTYWIEYRLWGLHPLGYHIDNVLLHAANAIMLWIILRRLSVPGTWLAAAIFALHPVHVESVAWITERKNVLSGLFYLAAMLAYLEGSGFGVQGSGNLRKQVSSGSSSLNPEEASKRNTSRLEPQPRTLNPLYFLSLAFFICALLSKTVTCSLPAAILLVLWWKRGRIGWRRDVVLLIPSFAIGLALALVTAHLERSRVGAQGAEWAFTFFERCLIAGRALWFYAWKLLWPADLAFIYPKWRVDPSSALQYLYPAAAVIIVVVLWQLRRRIGRGPLVAVLFFAGTLVPALGFFNVYPMRYSFVADHFQYLASIGLICLAAGGMHTLSLWHGLPVRLGESASGTTRAKRCETSENRIYRLIGALCTGWKPVPREAPILKPVAYLIVLLPLGLLTWRQGRIYESSETLWRDTLVKNSDSWMVHTNLGKALDEQNKLDEAVVHYERALRLAPHLPETHWNVGIGLAKRKRFDEAIARYREAIRIDPHFAGAYFSIGNALMEQEKLDAAKEYFLRAIQEAPSYAEARFNLGVVLEKLGDLPAAIEQYTLLVQQHPGYAEAHYNLGNCLLHTGRMREAITHYDQVIRLRPDDARAYFNRGAALLKMGEREKAEESFGRALQLDPSLAPVQTTN